LALLIAFLLFSLPLELLAAGIPKLDAPPLGERWYSIVMDNERVGFARLNISAAEDGYLIETQGSVKLRVMGFSREATNKESYLVGRDLSLRSFSSESRIDGNPTALKGEVTPKGIKVAVDTAGSRKERTLKTKGTVYAPQALNLYPLMQGTAKGKRYKLQIIDVESVKVKQIKVEVIGEETLASGAPTVHLRNNLYPVVDNDIWMDLQGNSLKESVRDDLVLTLAEDQATAKLKLANESLARKDFALDYSLIRVAPPIDRPEELKKLSVEMSGIPVSLPLLQGASQSATRHPDGAVLFTMPSPAAAGNGNPANGPATNVPAASVPAANGAAADGEAPAAAYLQPAQGIPSDAPEIIAKKGEILGAETNPTRSVQLLAEWVAKKIEGTVTDSQSPLETLKSGKGNCQSHARLYTALARAAGIPTRLVSGLVYAPGQGFLYHSWVESYLNGWVPVDPTFGQTPADLTHIKLVEGDSPDELSVLAGVIGRVQMKIVEKSY